MAEISTTTTQKANHNSTVSKREEKGMFSQPGRGAGGGTNIPNNSAPAPTSSPSLVALFVNVNERHDNTTI